MQYFGMHGPRFGPSRMSLGIFVSELSFQYPHRHAILWTAHRHLHPRSQEHQTALDPRSGLHPVVLPFVVRLYVVLLAALIVVPEAIHVAVWVAVLPGAHRVDPRDHPIALQSDYFPEFWTVYRSHPTLPFDDPPHSLFPDKFLLWSPLVIASKTVREPCQP